MNSKLGVFVIDIEYKTSYFSLTPKLQSSKKLLYTIKLNRFPQQYYHGIVVLCKMKRNAMKRAFTNGRKDLKPDMDAMNMWIG